MNDLLGGSALGPGVEALFGFQRNDRDRATTLQNILTAEQNRSLAGSREQRLNERHPLELEQLRLGNQGTGIQNQNSQFELDVKNRVGPDAYAQDKLGGFDRSANEERRKQAEAFMKSMRETDDPTYAAAVSGVPKQFVDKWLQSTPEQRQKLYDHMDKQKYAQENMKQDDLHNREIEKIRATGEENRRLEQMRIEAGKYKGKAGADSVGGQILSDKLKKASEKVALVRALQAQAITEGDIEKARAYQPYIDFLEPEAEKERYARVDSTTPTIVMDEKTGRPKLGNPTPPRPQSPSITPGSHMGPNSVPSAAPAAPPAGAVNFLKANPGTRADFDAKYGKGAAAKILGN